MVIHNSCCVLGSYFSDCRLNIGPYGLKIICGFTQSLHADVGKLHCIVLHDV
jgi:hypothetical protein